MTQDITPSLNHIHIVKQGREMFANFVGCGLLEVGYKNLEDGSCVIRRYWKTKKGWELLSTYHDVI